MVETSPDAIVLSAFDGRLLVASRQAALLGGYDSLESLLASGKNSLDYLLPEDKERAGSDILKLVETSLLRNVHYTIIRTDGSRVPVEINAALLKDQLGNPSGVLCVVRDISERKRAEAALAEAAREWSVSFDAMADAVSLHGPDHTILNVNQALCDLLGKSKEELISQKCHQIFHGKDAPVAQCPLEASRRSLCQGARRSFRAVAEQVVGDVHFPRLGRFRRPGAARTRRARHHRTQTRRRTN